VQLARPAARVRDLQQIEHAGDPHRTADHVAGKRLQEIEDEVRLAPRDATRELGDVIGNRQRGRLVTSLAQGLGYLVNHTIGSLGIRFLVSKNGDIHKSKSRARLGSRFKAPSRVSKSGARSAPEVHLLRSRARLPARSVLLRESFSRV